MRAVVLRRGELVVDEVAEPVLSAGKVLAETIACGICGSDVHLQRDPVGFNRTAKDVLGVDMFDPDGDFIMGHEISARVLEVGPDVTQFKPGDLLVGVPSDFRENPGGFGERISLTASACLPLPDGTDPRHAALTEPMAVGLLAVRRSGISAADAAIVYGCGPIGLATIAALKADGLGPIIAVEPSPARRRLAEHFGADSIVDPTDADPVAVASRLARGRRLIAFNGVGVPGFLNQLMLDLPAGTTIVQSALTHSPDPINLMVGTLKAASIVFVFGFGPGDLALALDRIATGVTDVEPLITGEITMSDTKAAFGALAHPERHAKILIEPGRSTSIL